MKGQGKLRTKLPEAIKFRIKEVDGMIATMIKGIKRKIEAAINRVEITIATTIQATTAIKAKRAAMKVVAIKAVIKERKITAIALLIALGSSVDMMAIQQIGGPEFDIFKTHIDRTYSVTDHLNVYVDHYGSIELVLSKYQFSINTKGKTSDLQQIVNLPDLNSNAWTKEWKSSDLPIFCRAEHLIQKQSGIAFRFRLGSVDYVNALEGK